MSKLISNRLEQLEREIELGIRSIGKALLEIHETKAYLDHYDTFETYCKERWGFTDRHARDLINAETVREKIGRTLPVETLKTQHLLEISKVPPSKQTQVAASVIAEAEAENRTPTTKDFKTAAKEFIKPKPDPKPEPIQDVWEDVPDTEPEVETKAKPERTKAESVSLLKTLIKNHNAAMMRAVGDLHTIAPNKTGNDAMMKLFREIHAAIEAWK